MRNFIGIGAAALLLASCGGEREGTIQTEDGEVEYSVDANGTEFSADITGDDGEQMSIRSGPDNDVQLPDGFSLYPGATVITSTVLNQADGMGTLVVFTSPDSADDIVAYHRAQADAAGVTIQSEITAGGSKVIAGEGADGLTFSLNASPGNDATTGQLAVGRGLN